MARDLICDVDHVEVARWLIGDLRTGDQLAVCDAHFVVWSVAQVDAMATDEARLQAMMTLSAKLPPPPSPEAAEAPQPKRHRGRSVAQRQVDVGKAAGIIAPEAQAIENAPLRPPAPEGVEGEKTAAPDG